MTEPTKTLTSRDWTPLFQAFADALAWVLDRASDFARAYPDEVAAVERVRTFVHKRIAGDPAHVRVDDLLFTLGLIAGAIERSREVRGTSQRTNTAPHAPAASPVPVASELRAVPMHLAPERATPMQLAPEIAQLASELEIQRALERIAPQIEPALRVIPQTPRPFVASVPRVHVSQPVAHSPQSRVVRMSRRQPRLEMLRRDVRPQKSSRKEFVRV